MLMKRYLPTFIVVLIVSFFSHLYVYLVLFLSNALTIAKIPYLVLAYLFLLRVVSMLSSYICPEHFFFSV